MEKPSLLKLVFYLEGNIHISITIIRQSFIVFHWLSDTSSISHLCLHNKTHQRKGHSLGHSGDWIQLVVFLVSSEMTSASMVSCLLARELSWLSAGAGQDWGWGAGMQRWESLPLEVSSILAHSSPQPYISKPAKKHWNLMLPYLYFLLLPLSFHSWGSLLTLGTHG